MLLSGDTSALTAPGQFVNIKLDGFYLRRPISICDYDDKTITIIYKVVGGGTEKMAEMKSGEKLDILTGLGNGFDLQHHFPTKYINFLNVVEFLKIYYNPNEPMLVEEINAVNEFMEQFKVTPKLTACYSHLTNAFVTPMPHSQAMEDAMLDETLRIFVDEPAAEGYPVYLNIIPHEHSVGVIRKVIDKTCEIAGKTYGADKDNDISIRVITDHTRSAMFMIADGVIPSNEGRGYVLRRIIRRACRHGKLLGINHPFLVDTVTVSINESCRAYPELDEKRDYILKVISMEEERFDATIDAGLSILSDLIRGAISDHADTISGEEVFKLYDTFGFPIDLTREIAAESNLNIDEETFQSLMLAQKKRAREARANIGGWDESSKSLLSDLPKTEFTGYTDYRSSAKVIAILWKEYGKLPLVGHKDIVATACPGRWYDKFGKLAEMAEVVFNGGELPESECSECEQLKKEVANLKSENAALKAKIVAAQNALA